MTQTDPYILTLGLEQAAFERLDALRQAYFPPERNYLAAHITLFHALPAEQGEPLRDTLETLCAATAPFAVEFPGLRSLGRGVAVAVESPGLIGLRRRLATAWGGWLSQQDRQGYRPHVTIQNKVASAEARALLEQLAPAWQPLTAQAEGLQLWHYRGGPWERAAWFPFSGTSADPPQT